MRIIPYFESGDFEATRAFYTGVLGLHEGEFGGDHVGFADGDSQVVFGRAGTLRANMGVDLGSVAAVDAALAAARDAGHDVVYGPVTEPWGVYRFFVQDPTGTVVSVLAHA